MGNFDVEYPIINVPSAGTGLTQHSKALLFLDYRISKAKGSLKAKLTRFVPDNL
jgi:hypothetical protein